MVGLVSSAAAPVLLTGGWTVAAGLQPRSFNAVAGTMSALAARGAADRWVMTLVFAVVGACFVVTGLALRPAAAPGRVILIAGGVALAGCGQPRAGQGRFPAARSVGGGRVRRPGGLAGRGLAARTAGTAGNTAGGVGHHRGSLGRACWRGSARNWSPAPGRPGPAERVLAGMQAVWPLAVVLSCRQRGRRWAGPDARPGLTRR